MRKPDISIFSSAYRPQYWMDLYKSIGDNNVGFEIVFAGPNKPDYTLPDNFKFIRSYTKPAQCFEIAARNTTADLIMCIADDMEFRTKRPLDRLYNAYKSRNNEKLILSCRYMLNGECMPISEYRFFPADENSPIMSLAGLMSRKLYKDIGGIDRNFIAVMWDMDIAMRVYAKGGEVVLSDVYIDELKGKSCGSTLCLDRWAHDRGFLESLWLINGKIHFNRARPVEPFSDLRIIEESQGPRGRWRGSSPVVFEKLADLCSLSYRSSRAVLGRVCHAVKNPRKYPEYAKRILSKK